MLLRREAVRALAGVEGRLLHPVPDRLGRGLKLAPERLGRSAMPDQLDHLPPERRRVRPMALRHRGRSLPPQPWGVHETGSIPISLRRLHGGPEMAPKPPTLGSAPAPPWRPSISLRRLHRGPEMAPKPPTLGTAPAPPRRAPNSLRRLHRRPAQAPKPPTPPAPP